VCESRSFSLSAYTYRDGRKDGLIYIEREVAAQSKTLQGFLTLVKKLAKKATLP